MSSDLHVGEGRRAIRFVGGHRPLVARTVRILFACHRRKSSLLDGGVKGGVKGGVPDAGRGWHGAAGREMTQPHNLQKRREAEGLATSCL